MNTPAIHKAMRLNKHPEEMAWLCFPDSDFPEGMNDLLRMAASEEQLIEFADTNGLDSKELSMSLFHFIEKAMLTENNSAEKILGTDKFSTSQEQKFHYEILMKIYHPDQSKRPNAKQYSELITKSYEALKIEDKKQDDDNISFSEYRKLPTNYHQTTKKAETQISYAKTAMAILSAVTIILLVTMAGKLYGPENPELITSNQDTKNIVKSDGEIAQQIIMVTSLKKEINPQPPQRSIQASSTAVQTLLKGLEIAYEKGDVDVIKPLLANAPEIKNQTEKQLNEKLETIFQITDERKMLLFDFDWTNVSGNLEGKGKFISRYLLVGENTWLTREGTAQISAEKIKNKLKVTQLILENKTID